ncbi:hypothetical protein F8M41_018035 [Gigaspora margarita]|uniref:Zn(2)-C6 fungal-type domain-containing protein n=1 Tax=Gigaspora margarita TaxID=4874 RepID=A0A8H4AM36_GIGMA|nr:hypothetical protein F8M41_018035 [Gigaspora margarita]
MSFLHQEKHQRRQQQQQQQGPYTAKACTNCQQKHAKCSGGTACKRCTQRTFPENDIDGTSMLSFVIHNSEQGYASTLSFPSEYL